MHDLRRESGRGSLALIAFLVAAPVVIGGAVALFVRHVPRTTCANEVLVELPARDGTHRAVVYHRSCGPAAPLTTNVSVVPADAPLPDDVGNLLIVKDAQELAVRWSAPGHVVIAYPRDAGAQLEYGGVYGIEATLEPR